MFEVRALRGSKLGCHYNPLPDLLRTAVPAVRGANPDRRRQECTTILIGVIDMQ
jgi:hypothetical protein